MRAIPLLIMLAVAARADWSAPVDFTALADYEVGLRAGRDSSGGIHAVWYGGAADSVNWRVYYQNWNGTSWSAPVAISGAAAGACDVAVDGAGGVHAVWHAGGNPEEVYYRKAGGGVWGATTNLSNSGNRSLNPRLDVNAAGDRIAVAWHESAQTGGEWDVLCRRWSGGTWQTAENVSNDGSLSRSADVIMDPTGAFHLAWEDLGDNHLYYSRRPSGGSWSARVALDNSSGRSFGAALALAPNGHVHAAWHDDNDDWEIVHRGWDGAAWGAITNISQHPDPDHADNSAQLIVDANNQVHCVWHDYQNVYYAHTSGGAWRPRVTLSSGSNQGGPHLVFGAGARLYALWASRDPGSWDGFFAWQDVPDVTPPGPVTSFRVYATNGQNRLDWSYPPQIDRSGVRLRWKAGGFPTSPSDGTLLADISYPATTRTHTGLTNGTTYYYAAFAYDAEPNFSAAATVAGTPTAAPKPNLLTNGGMSSLTGWQTYRINDPNLALTFTADTANVESTPAYAIQGIDSAALPAAGLSAAGFFQIVNGTTPGRVYQFVGYQDIHTTDFGADSRRYLHNFGIHPSGSNQPGTATTNGSIAGAKWTTPAQAFWNNNPGGAPMYGGYHRATAATVAQGTSISVWTGLTIDNTAAKDNAAAKFNVDTHYLFEWEFPVEPSLQNAGFEGAIIDLQDGGDGIADRWLPAGGGVGGVQSWACGPAWPHSGVNGVRMWSRRGATHSGLMQKIAAAPGANYTFSAWTKCSGQDSAAASVGIDPAGGGDITATGIVWQSTSAAAWTQLAVTAAAQGGALTVFLRTASPGTAGANYQWSDFDDASLTSGATAPFVMVPRGSVWRYHYDWNGQPSGVRAAGFDDSAWPEGLAQLGYGEGDEVTMLNPVPPNPPPGAPLKPMTAYFRRPFEVTDPSAVARLHFSIVRDDGVLVCLNGVELLRDNLPPGPIDALTAAVRNVSAPEEVEFQSYTADPGLLRTGTNMLLVEIHQQAGSSNDISFDLELLGERGPADSDGDGLPDAWEQQHFGNLAQAGDGDADGDGQSNAGELRARTLPADGNSVFRASLTGAGVTWPTVIGINYRVQSASDLTAWENESPLLRGDGSLLTWPTDDISGARRFYRVTAAAP